MNWINLNVAVLDSEEFIGADPTDRATWLCLLRYCAGQENGGRIMGARQWKDRKWQQVVRVTLKEISAECDLWRWEGDDLVVLFYPSEKEAEVQTNRKNGALGGRPKKAKGEPNKEPDDEPNGNHPVSDGKTDGFKIGETERKGRERKGKEDTPLPPEGGEEGGPRILPKGWKNMPQREQKLTKVLANSPSMIRIGSWFGRRPDTLWTIAEAAALLLVRPEEPDVELMARYYEAVMPAERDYRRRDLQTLLNNWSGELDRARVWTLESP